MWWCLASCSSIQPLSSSPPKAWRPMDSRVLKLGCTSEPCAVAAAKSLQSCLTLCDPIDGSPPGFPVPGILQARTLEWVAIFLSNAWKWKVKVKLLSHVWLFATPWTSAYPGSSVHGIFQARVLEWGAIVFSQNHVRCIKKKKKKLQMVHASHCRLNQSAMTGWSLSLRSEPTWLTNFNAILMTWKEGSIIQTSIHGAVSKGEEEFSVGICNG